MPSLGDFQSPLTDSNHPPNLSIHQSTGKLDLAVDRSELKATLLHPSLDSASRRFASYPVEPLRFSNVASLTFGNRKQLALRYRIYGFVVAEFIDPPDKDTVLLLAGALALGPRLGKQTESLLEFCKKKNSPSLTDRANSYPPAEIPIRNAELPPSQYRDAQDDHKHRALPLIRSSIRICSSSKSSEELATSTCQLLLFHSTSAFLELNSYDPRLGATLLDRQALTRKLSEDFASQGPAFFIDRGELSTRLALTDDCRWRDDLERLPIAVSCMRELATVGSDYCVEISLGKNQILIIANDKVCVGGPFSTTAVAQHMHLETTHFAGRPAV